MQRAAAGEATKAAEPEPSVPTGPGVLAHLNDIFIDAFRHSADDRYAVEYAYVVHPGLAAEVPAVAQVLARHEIFAAALAFSRDGVVLTPNGNAPSVRQPSARSYAELRDPVRLGLRAPAHLLDAAVARIEGASNFSISSGSGAGAQRRRRRDGQ